MAKHILDGENFLYFYGQAYMGSLDAYLVALAFLVLGEKVIAIRLVQIFLYAIVIIFVYLIIEKFFEENKTAFVGSLYLVFAPVNVILYTTVSLGGYGEALLLGIISFYLCEAIRRKLPQKKNYGGIFLLGLLVGAGLFINPLSFTMMVPAILYLIYKAKEIDFPSSSVATYLLIFLGSFLTGSSLFWYSLFFSNGIATVNEITGSAVAVGNSLYINQIFEHLRSFILFGPTVIFGIRPPWSVEWIGILFIPVVLFFWSLILYLFFSKKIIKEEKEKIVAVSMIIIFTILGFIFTSFGVDPSGRYFLPLVIPISVIFGYAVVKFKNKLVLVLSVLIIFYQIYGTVTLSSKPPYLTTQFYVPAQVDHTNIDNLIYFLEENNEKYGFSNYWVSYPLTFLSDEEIISIPKLPYHNDFRYTERDNRIDKYNAEMVEARKFFYIITNNDPLDMLIQEKFIQKQITYLSKRIDNYQIYYNLSQKITPEELGLFDEYK